MVTVLNIPPLGPIRGWIQSHSLGGAADRAWRGGKDELASLLRTLKGPPRRPFVMVADDTVWHIIIAT